MRTLRKIGALALLVLLGLAIMAVWIMSMGVSYARAGEPESIAAFGWLLPIADLIDATPPIFLLLGVALCSVGAAGLLVKLVEELLRAPVDPRATVVPLADRTGNHLHE